MTLFIKQWSWADCEQIEIDLQFQNVMTCLVKLHVLYKVQRTIKHTRVTVILMACFSRFQSPRRPFQDFLWPRWNISFDCFSASSTFYSVQWFPEWSKSPAGAKEISKIYIGLQTTKKEGEVLDFLSVTLKPSILWKKKLIQCLLNHGVLLNYSWQQI